MDAAVFLRGPLAIEMSLGHVYEMFAVPADLIQQPVQLGQVLGGEPRSHHPLEKRHVQLDLGLAASHLLWRPLSLHRQHEVQLRPAFFGIDGRRSRQQQHRVNRFLAEEVGRFCPTAATNAKTTNAERI